MLALGTLMFGATLSGATPNLPGAWLDLKEGANGKGCVEKAIPCMIDPLCRSLLTSMKRDDTDGAREACAANSLCQAFMDCDPTSRRRLTAKEGTKSSKDEDEPLGLIIPAACKAVKEACEANKACNLEMQVALSEKGEKQIPELLNNAPWAALVDCSLKNQVPEKRDISLKCEPHWDRCVAEEACVVNVNKVQMAGSMPEKCPVKGKDLCVELVKCNFVESDDFDADYKGCADKIMDCMFDVECIQAVMVAAEKDEYDACLENDLCMKQSFCMQAVDKQPCIADIEKCWFDSACKKMLSDAEEGKEVAYWENKQFTKTITCTAGEIESKDPCHKEAIACALDEDCGTWAKGVADDVKETDQAWKDCLAMAECKALVECAVDDGSKAPAAPVKSSIEKSLKAASTSMTETAKSDNLNGKEKKDPKEPTRIEKLKKKVEGLSAGAIAGIVIGALVAGIGLGVCIYCIVAK